MDLRNFETITIHSLHCHSTPDLPIPAHPEILQVSRARQRMELRSIRASGWASGSWASKASKAWKAWKAWAASSRSRSMSSPRALKRRKPSRCNLRSGIESGNWEDLGSITRIATPATAWMDVLALQSLQSSFLVYASLCPRPISIGRSLHSISIVPLSTQQL